MLYVAGGHEFVFTLCLREKHSSGIQILKPTHSQTHATAECRDAFLLSRTERLRERGYLLKNFQVQNLSGL